MGLTHRSAAHRSGILLGRHCPKSDLSLVHLHERTLTKLDFASLLLCVDGRDLFHVTSEVHTTTSWEIPLLEESHQAVPVVELNHAARVSILKILDD